MRRCAVSTAVLRSRVHQTCTRPSTEDFESIFGRHRRPSLSIFGPWSRGVVRTWSVDPGTRTNSTHSVVGALRRSAFRRDAAARARAASPGRGRCVVARCASSCGSRSRPPARPPPGDHEPRWCCHAEISWTSAASATTGGDTTGRRVVPRPRRVSSPDQLPRHPPQTPAHRPRRIRRATRGGRDARSNPSAAAARSGDRPRSAVNTSAAACAIHAGSSPGLPRRARPPPPARGPTCRTAAVTASVDDQPSLRAPPRQQLRQRQVRRQLAPAVERPARPSRSHLRAGRPCSRADHPTAPAASRPRHPPPCSSATNPATPSAATAAARTSRASSTRAGSLPAAPPSPAPPASVPAQPSRPRPRSPSAPAAAPSAARPPAAADVVPARPEPPTGVLPHQHHRDVDVIIRMPDRHPPRPTRIPLRRDTGAVQQLARRSPPTPHPTTPDPPALTRAEQCQTYPRLPVAGRPPAGPAATPAPATPGSTARAPGPTPPGPVDGLPAGVPPVP